jgi:hypothetical protein
MKIAKYCKNFLRVTPSRKLPKGLTHPIRIKFPVQISADRALANQLRSEAISDLEHAIEHAKDAVRLSTTSEQHAYATWFLESLRQQVPPPSESPRIAQASGACRGLVHAGGVFL